MKTVQSVLNTFFEDTQTSSAEFNNKTREYRVTERSNSSQVARQTEHRSVYFVI